MNTYTDKWLDEIIKSLFDLLIEFSPNNTTSRYLKKSKDNIFWLKNKWQEK